MIDRMRHALRDHFHLHQYTAEKAGKILAAERTVGMRRFRDSLRRETAVAEPIGGEIS